MMKVLPAVLSLALVATMLPLGAQPRTKRIGRVAETALVGIPLYSPGLKVINKYGPPDEILGITLGGSGNAGGGGGGGGGEQGLTRPPKNGGGGAAPGNAGAGEMSPPGSVTRPGTGEDFIGDPFSNVGWQQASAGAGEMSPPGSDSRDGTPALPGAPGGGGGAGGGGGSTTTSSVQYTKWVYKRKNARYSFVIDKFNRVVQIEAVGLNDPNVRTARGIKFGNNFKDLSNKYFQPDGYDLAGDSFVVKYLQRGKVAFRFSRLEPKKPHVITGIVVAAGK